MTDDAHINMCLNNNNKSLANDALQQFVFFLTSPVLGLEDRRQLARRNLSGHLSGALCLPMLASHVERCVPILVLQLQAGPFLHQALHHLCQVQVGGQVQRALRIAKENRCKMQSKVHVSG